MVSERLLRKWRKEALMFNPNLKPEEAHSQSLYIYDKLKEANSKIIRMTQVLLDQHLLNK